MCSVRSRSVWMLQRPGIGDAGEEKGVVNQVGYHYRYLGTFIEAKRLLAASLIGKIHHIRAEAYGPVVLRPKGIDLALEQGGGRRLPI